MIWHSTSTADILAELEVDDKNGLPNGVADMRLQINGKNVISSIEKPTFFKRFAMQFKSKIVIFLIVVALVSFFVSLMYREVNSFSPLLIIGIVVMNAALSAYQLHGCDDALDSMKNYTSPTTSVLRDGIVKSVNSALLVPGDIIILEAGDYIPADARIIECNEFRCNESQFTGEEIPVEKNADVLLEDITAVEERKNMVFSGTSVAHGTAKAVVTATGLNTEIGHTSAILQQTGETVLPLENELDGIGKTVNAIILAVCGITFVIGMIQNFSSGNFASMTLKTLVNSVALAVAAIPESLPAIATVVIALGLKRIVHSNIIVKDSAALETLGKTDVICSDKTGILTRNKMRLAKIYDGDKLTDVTSEPLDEKTALVLKLATACSTLRNDSTEDAIKKACLTFNSMSEKDIEGFFPKLAVIPFDSERKTMTVITMINEKPFAIVKGAPENVIPNCTGCDSEKILELNEKLASEALRIVCIAMRPLDNIPANPNPEDTERELTFVGLLGLDDPPRDTVIDDIKTCADAGIRTVMITGDNLATASSVARRIGILTDGTKAITGEELADLSDKDLENSIKDYSVYARISPQDKTRIVRAWQKSGGTVTVTGDSVQDAEALCAADVGCAMGKFGADVAKGNADIIIANNRFSSVVCAIRESRGLFDNIKKAVYYLISCNFGELITVLAGLLAFAVSPVSAVQLLWVNMLTDSAPAVALSMESAEDTVMKRKPDSAIGKIFSGTALLNILLQSVFIAAMSITAFVIGRKSGNAVGMSMTFGVLSMSQIFHCYNNKSFGSVINKRIFSNKFMNYSAVLALFITVFLLFTPAGHVFGMAVLTFKQFMISLLLSLIIVPFAELLKLLDRIKD